MIKQIVTLIKYVAITSISVGGAYCLLQLYEKEKLYKKASVYFANKDYNTAQIIFNFLGNYKNSRKYYELAVDNEEKQILNDLINDGNLDFANEMLKDMEEDIDKPLSPEEFETFKSRLKAASDKRKIKVEPLNNEVMNNENKVKKFRRELDEEIDNILKTYQFKHYNNE